MVKYGEDVYKRGAVTGVYCCLLFYSHTFNRCFCLRNDRHCVGWGLALNSTHSLQQILHWLHCWHSTKYFHCKVHMTCICHHETTGSTYSQNMVATRLQASWPQDSHQAKQLCDGCCKASKEAWQNICGRLTTRGDHLNGRLHAAVWQQRSNSVYMGLACCCLSWTAALWPQHLWRRYAKM